MPQTLSKIKRLAELRTNPDLALYDEINDKSEEIKGVVQDTANTLNSSLEANLGQLKGVLDETQTKINDLSTKEEVINKIDELKTYLDNLEIEISV